MTRTSVRERNAMRDAGVDARALPKLAPPVQPLTPPPGEKWPARYRADVDALEQAIERARRETATAQDLMRRIVAATAPGRIRDAAAALARGEEPLASVDLDSLRRDYVAAAELHHAASLVAGDLRAKLARRAVEDEDWRAARLEAYVKTVEAAKKAAERATAAVAELQTSQAGAFWEPAPRPEVVDAEAAEAARTGYFSALNLAAQVGSVTGEDPVAVNARHRLEAAAAQIVSHAEAQVAVARKHVAAHRAAGRHAAAVDAEQALAAAEAHLAEVRARDAARAGVVTAG